MESYSYRPYGTFSFVLVPKVGRSFWNRGQGQGQGQGKRRGQGQGQGQGRGQGLNDRPILLLLAPPGSSWLLLAPPGSS